MANPVLIGAKLNLKRSSLKSVEDKIAELLAKRSELEASIDGVESEEDLTAIEASVKENDDAITVAEEEKSTLEEEIEGLESELEASNRKKPKAGGKNMPKQTEAREAINAFVRSKGQVRDMVGFKVVDGGALIPEELIPAKKAPEDTVDLKKFINVRPVNRGSGKYPVIKKSGSKMVSVAELEKNPELAKPTISEVGYDIETYRGYIPISQEAIDDADYDIAGMIADEIADQELNTTNTAIAAVLKSAPAKAVTGLDGFKKVFNKDIKKVYNAKAVISASLYNELDTMKDANGRYLLQDDITVASGKRLFGKEVVVLDDDMIGTSDGDLVGFVGDPKAFATFFNRKQASVKWVDHNIYGQLLAGFIRFDVVATDTDAGFYVTFTPDDVPTP
ncbi:phage major capsid protein [Sporosarcina highlanderae]|uniref:Phage major capsid protein n=1 Tax=Sporosarcina highlanderae TaxID=3035916 RepID=A0ABT8JVC5_9BACL|nr:phage major capsid protein [Sporosarcina highlanderae]MDN4609128.1 phage major capsid protein [Sporosarcina highlanderae]